MTLLRTFSFALLVVLAGCTGTSTVGDSPDTTNDTVTTATPIPTTTPPTTVTSVDSPGSTADTRTTHQTVGTARYTDCNASLHVSPAENLPNGTIVVEYEGLSPERRSEFDRALVGHATLSDQSESYSFWVETYVQKGTETYATSVAIC